MASPWRSTVPRTRRWRRRPWRSIERASVRIWDVLSFYPTKPIAVVLYTNEQFRDITRSPAWAAGAFDGTIRIPMRGALANPAELDRVLAHEYTHALVHELAAGSVPAWLDEGLAAALERDSPREAPPAEDRVPLRTLEKSFGRLSDRDVKRAYALSAFAVRRLLDDAGGAARHQSDSGSWDRCVVRRRIRAPYPTHVPRLRGQSQRALTPDSARLQPRPDFQECNCCHHSWGGSDVPGSP